MAPFRFTRENQEDAMIEQTRLAKSEAPGDGFDDPDGQGPETHKDVDIGQEPGATTGSEDENASG